MAALPNVQKRVIGGGRVPWLSVKDFNNGNRYVEKSDEHITELGLQNSSTKLLQPGMIIVSARGTVGEMAQLKREMAFNQSCYGIDANKEYLDNDYLFYLLKTKIQELKSIAHGSVFDTITGKTFENISVTLPARAEQKAIAHILGTLDDKIELNRKMNETLEEIAKAVFKSWFVDFDPVCAKMEGRPTGLPPPPPPRSATFFRMNWSIQKSAKYLRVGSQKKLEKSLLCFWGAPPQEKIAYFGEATFRG